MSRWVTKKKKTLKNLLGEQTNVESTHDEKEDEKDKAKDDVNATYTTILYWKPTATINLVIDQTAYPRNQLTNDLIET
jgi:hypothetical protein